MSGIVAIIDLNRHPRGAGSTCCIKQSFYGINDSIGVACDGGSERSNLRFEAEFTYRSDCGDDMGPRMSHLEWFDQELSGARAHCSPLQLYQL
jgi:hypothetical protein